MLRMRPVAQHAFEAIEVHGQGNRTVLVVEDEADIRELICVALARGGWATLEAAGPAEALALLASNELAAVTLDVKLAGESGYELCRTIRGRSSVPILFVTARADEFDHVLGLELGADDYITKPFSPAVLTARVAAAVRRGAHGRQTDDRTVRVGPIALDPIGRRVFVRDRQLELTKTEFDLLATFLAEPTTAFDRDTLLDRVWGDWYSGRDVVDVTVSRLRRKLTDAGADGFIETLRGVGYRLAT